MVKQSEPSVDSVGGPQDSLGGPGRQLLFVFWLEQLEVLCSVRHMQQHHILLFTFWLTSQFQSTQTAAAYLPACLPGC
jgi:hypothetical protein